MTKNTIATQSLCAGMTDFSMLIMHLLGDMLLI